MGAALENRVRERREARGFSQVALAGRTLLTRQSIGAIEAGRVTPSVDVALRLAAVLDCPVEELFNANDDGALVSAERATASRGGRVALARIADRWVSYPLLEDGVRLAADGLVKGEKRGQQEVELLRSKADLDENVVLMGCANAMGVLADRLNARRGPGRFLWFSRSSDAALKALEKRRTHVAGLHLVDARTDEANVPFVRRQHFTEPVQLIALGRWEAGLVVRPDANPIVQKAADLARPGLRIVGREPGSGAQRLLERTLASEGLPLTLARARTVRAANHLDLARAVASGLADVGVATRDAALAFGLGFVPLAEERFDLAVFRSALGDVRFERLFDVLCSGPFRRELTTLGYDAGPAGERVAEVPAA
jgi:putative molybdopterin biosynthesis protein